MKRRAISIITTAAAFAAGLAHSDAAAATSATATQEKPALQANVASRKQAAKQESATAREKDEPRMQVVYQEKTASREQVAPRALILTLEEAERRGVENSPRIKASSEEARAASEQASSQHSSFYPRLSLDANYRYVTEVPTVRLGGRELPFGDNESYSIGPVLSYTLFDFGARGNTYHGLSLLADSRASDAENARRQALLMVRVAYAQAQLAQEEMKRVDESLALARTQNRDIEQRFRAGAASRLDLLNSQNEVSSFEIRAEQARTEYQAAAAELGAWVGEFENPESLVLDPLEATASKVEIAALAPPTGAHPQLKAQEKLAESLESAAKAQDAGRLPTVQLQAKASLDYPNGPNLEQIQQKTLSVGVSIPLVEWGRSERSAEQKRAEAAAARYRREQTERDLKKDWIKALARIEGFKRQAENAERTVRQSEEIARLRYESYKAGKISFIEVQSANLKLLDTRVQKARIEAQMLAQYHTLRSLEAP